MDQPHDTHQECARHPSTLLVLKTTELIQRYVWDLMVALTVKEPIGPETLAKKYRALVTAVENEDPGLGLVKRSTGGTRGSVTSSRGSCSAETSGTCTRSGARHARGRSEGSGSAAVEPTLSAKVRAD